MQVDGASPIVAASQDVWAILDALLYSVSHDLRSPLLTMTLSADLIEEGLPAERDSEALAIGLSSLRQGGADLERMIAALTSLSRARREQVTPSRVPLGLLLGGYETAGADGSTDTDIGTVHVRADAIVVRECIDAVMTATESDVAVTVSLGQDGCRLEVPLPEAFQGEASPLTALAGSLRQFAGTFVEVLAAHQLRLERCGNRMAISKGTLRIDLPLDDSQ